MIDKKLKKGILAVLIANLINVFFSLMTNFLLPKYLSYDSYANIKTFQLYVSYVGLLHFGYVDGMYLKYGGASLSKKVDKEFSLNLSTMRFFELIVTLTLFIIALFTHDKILILFTLSIFPQNVSNYFKFLFQATGEFSLYGRVMNLSTIATFAVNMFLLFLLKTDNSFQYIILYVILYYLIWITLELYFYTHHEIEKSRVFSFFELKTNVKDGFLLTLGNLASMLLTSMDRWFVKFLMNSVAFAQYSFAVSVQNFLNLAITPVTTTLYNYFCREKDTDNYKKVFRYILVFATLLPAAAFPVKFILEVFLQKYIDSSVVVFLLFAAQMFSIIINAVFVNLYKVQRKQHVYFIKLVSILFIGFIFNVLCFQVVHAKESFAVGTLLSSLIWFLLSKNDFKFLSISIKEYIYLYAEVIAFLIYGFRFKSLIGLLLYIITTLFLLMMLMRDTFHSLKREGMKEIKRILKKG